MCVSTKTLTNLIWLWLMHPGELQIGDGFYFPHQESKLVMPQWIRVSARPGTGWGRLRRWGVRKKMDISETNPACRLANLEERDLTFCFPLSQCWFIDRQFSGMMFKLQKKVLYLKNVRKTIPHVPTELLIKATNRQRGGSNKEPCKLQRVLRNDAPAYLH